METLNKLTDTFKGSPIILALLVFNLFVLSGFWLTLGKIAEAADRRDQLLEKCISRS